MTVPNGTSGRHLDLYKKIWQSDNSDFTEQYLHHPNEIACPVILELMNVKYFLSNEPNLDDRFEKVFTTPEDEFHIPRYIYRLKETLPRAYVVASATTPPADSSLLDALCAINPRRTCLVEDHPVEGSADFQEVRVDGHSPADFSLNFHTDAPGVLVVSESWHPDWIARDKNRAIPIRRVNHNFLGIPVEPGDHEIRISYRPWDFYLGLLLALPVWCAVTIIGILFIRRRNSSLKPKPS